MSQSLPHYAVIAEFAPPDFLAERQFIERERQFVARQSAALAGGWSWRKVAGWLDQSPGREDWRRYDRALQRYTRQLARYEADMAAGLVPLKIGVFNNGDVADGGIEIKVEVVRGRIRPGARVPERPVPVDSSREKPWLWSVLTSGGFWRSGVKITPQSAKAKFARLGAHDGAYLITRPMHVLAGKQTELRYEIRSRGLDRPQAGQVEML